MGNLAIETDGKNTRIFDDETGVTITNVTSFNYSVNSQFQNTCTIDCILVPLVIRNKMIIDTNGIKCHNKRSIRCMKGSTIAKE